MTMDSTGMGYPDLVIGEYQDMQWASWLTQLSQEDPKKTRLIIFMLNGMRAGDCQGACMPVDPEAFSPHIPVSTFILIIL